MRPNTLAAIGVALIAGGLPACIPGDESPPGFRIVNRTDRTLEITSQTGAVYRPRPGGGDIEFFLDGCVDYRLEARWPDGTLVDALDSKFCGDEVWTISGVGRSKLK